MSATLLVQLNDGEARPLSECAWIVTEPCGCVSGIMTAQFSDGTNTIATEEAAWSHFYEFEGAEARKRDQAAGVTFRLVGHDEGHQLLRRTCEHVPQWGRKPRPEADGYRWAMAESYPRNAGSRLHLIGNDALNVDRWNSPSPAPHFEALCGKREKWWSAESHDTDGRVTCLRCERKAEAAT
ncbi:hypothetical protein [Streptomyces sp.]|uniref:hypothetical protein n=1 Tax=Streptomyces sp. TaxID=1931 RepID=UPI002F92160B